MSSLVRKAYAFSKMVDHMSLLRGFYDPFADFSPAMVGLEDSESLLTPQGDRKTIAEKHLGRHFLGIQ